MNNLENRIKQEFDNWDATLQPAVKAELTTLPKPRRVRKGAILAIAAVFALLTGTVVVGATGLFGVRQLAEIIGEEQAALTTAITFTNDYGYTAGEFTTEDGLHIGFMASAAHGNIVEIYVMMEDTIHNRLDGEFFLNYSLNILPRWEEWYYYNYIAHWGMAPSGFMIIDRGENGVVTLHMRAEFTIPLNNKEIAFMLHNVYVNMEHVHNYPIITDFTRLNHEPATILGRIGEDWPFTGIHHMAIGRSSELHDMISGDGLPILAPHQDDIDFTVDIPFAISSIGIIDDRLHVQTVGPHRPYGDPFIFSEQRGIRRMELRLGSLEMNGGIGFFLDDNGDFYLPYGIGFSVRQIIDRPHYTEHIFFLNMDRLEEYTLFGRFVVLDTIHIGWDTIIETGSGHSINISGLEIEYGSGVLNEIIITPVSVITNAVVDNFFADKVFGITIHTADGRAIRARFQSGSGTTRDDDTSDVNRLFGLPVSFLDLDTVVAVEVLGERIEVR